MLPTRTDAVSPSKRVHFNTAWRFAKETELSRHVWCKGRSVAEVKRWSTCSFECLCVPLLCLGAAVMDCGKWWHMTTSTAGVKHREQVVSYEQAPLYDKWGAWFLLSPHFPTIRFIYRFLSLFHSPFPLLFFLFIFRLSYFCPDLCHRRKTAASLTCAQFNSFFLQRFMLMTTIHNWAPNCYKTSLVFFSIWQFFSSSQFKQRLYGRSEDNYR